MFQKHIRDSTDMRPLQYSSTVLYGIPLPPPRWAFAEGGTTLHPHQLVWTVASSASLEARGTAAIAISAQARLICGLGRFRR